MWGESRTSRKGTGWKTKHFPKDVESAGTTEWRTTGQNNSVRRKPGKRGSLVVPNGVYPPFLFRGNRVPWCRW